MVYKIMVDYRKIDLDGLFNKFKTLGADICFSDGLIYIHFLDNKPLSVSDIMKEENINNYYLEQIIEKPKTGENNLIDRWVYEKLEEDIEYSINLNYQDRLQTMLDNIIAIKKLLERKEESNNE